MASTNGNSTPLHSQDWLTPSQAAHLVDRSRTTIHHACVAGDLETRTAANGYRRISRASVLTYYGYEVGEVEVRRIALYARCSSSGQKGHLVTQVERMQDWIEGKFSTKKEDIAVYSEIGSAFSPRPRFLALCDDIIAGKISVVCAEYRDRASRTSSEFTLFQHLCETYNVKIVFAELPVIVDEDKALWNEVIEFIQVATNRATAKKYGAKRVKHLPEEALERTHELKTKSGLSVRQITQILLDEGVRTERGEIFTHFVLMERYKEWVKKQEQKNILEGNLVQEKDIFDQFIQDRCLVGQDVSVFSSDFNQAWQEYCDGLGVLGGNPCTLAMKLKDRGYTNKKSTLGRQRWYGITVKT